MSQPQQPQPGPRLKHALAHPTRRAILDLLREKGVAPSSIAGKLGVGAANARYHVEVLTKCGAIEVVPDETRSGERLVRLAEPAPESGKAWLDVSGSMRDDVSAAQLKSLIEMASHLRPRHAPGG
jgi:DNA-binding transcriptional ArsR family regulator